MDHSEATPATGIMVNTGDPSVGVLRFQDGTAIADQITVNAKLANPPESTQYEVWLIDNSGEQSRSIGILAADENGTYSLRLLILKAEIYLRIILAWKLQWSPARTIVPTHQVRLPTLRAFPGEHSPTFDI